ncbi:MAG: hypothetical protein DIU60_002445 [Actinomycetes bacterium]|jgi:hypothetical protein|nr:MAG: hypothetical protein DIU60_19495 [Actinomycetota bacterium]
MSAFRRGTATALAVVAGAVTLAGPGLAQAATVQAGTLQAGAAQAGTAQAAAFRIPKNFLLHEAEYRKAKKPAKATFSDSRTRLRLIYPCAKGRADGKRVAARTIRLRVNETDWSAEQLIVYRSKREAKKGFAALRTDLARCGKGGKTVFERYRYRWKPVRIGDEALLVGLDEFEDAHVYAAARRGRAIFIYAHTGGWDARFRAKHFGAVERDARRMARKVCSLPGVC